MNGQATDQPTTSTSPDSALPPILPKLTIKSLKGVVHKSTFNPRTHVAQNYNVVEDLTQPPFSMSTLDILQSCPSQKQALLSAIGAIDLTDSNLVVFNHAHYVPKLPIELAF